jgi:hypothetical protein
MYGLSLAPFSINIWAVVIAVVINMALGSVWYSSLLFGDKWMNLIGKKKEDLSSPGMALGMMVVLAVFWALVVSVLMDWLGVKTYMRGAIVGFVLWLVYALSTLPDYIFSKKPYELFALNAGQYLVQFLLAGAVLGGMQ